MNNFLSCNWCSPCQKILRSQEQDQELLSLDVMTRSHNYKQTQRLLSPKSDTNSRLTNTRKPSQLLNGVSVNPFKRKDLKKGPKKPSLKQNLVLNQKIQRCVSQDITYLPQIIEKNPIQVQNSHVLSRNEMAQSCLIGYTERGTSNNLVLSYRPSSPLPQAIKRSQNPQIRFEYRPQEQMRSHFYENATPLQPRRHNFNIQNGSINVCYVPQTPKQQRKVKFRDEEKVNVYTEQTVPLITQKKISIKLEQDIYSSNQTTPLSSVQDLKRRVSENLLNFTQKAEADPYCCTGEETYQLLKGFNQKPAHKQTMHVRREKKHLTAFVASQSMPEQSLRSRFKTVKTVNSIAETVSEGSILDSNYMLSVGENKQLKRLV